FLATISDPTPTSSTDRLESTCNDLIIERLSFFRRIRHATTAKATDPGPGGGHHRLAPALDPLPRRAGAHPDPASAQPDSLLHRRRDPAHLRLFRGVLPHAVGVPGVVSRLSDKRRLG